MIGVDYLTSNSKRITLKSEDRHCIFATIMFFKKGLAVLSLLVATVCGNAVSYPRPSIYNKSAHFSLRVNGVQMYTVSYAGYDYVQLSMDAGQSHEFRIETLSQGSTIASYNISPKKLGISAKVEGNQLVFSLKDPQYLIVKIDSLKEFVIMVDPMETDVPASSGTKIHNVMNYGADATGDSVTTGIQKAMDAAAKVPGSIVYVPAGLYKIGNLMLRNQTSLYLAGGSVLRFTGNPSDYKQLYVKSDLHPGTWWIQTEFESTNIKIYGRGTIDGNGYNTRQNKFMANLVVPTATTYFKMDGVLVRDGSFWAVTPIQAFEVTITNIKILNRFDVTQDDGIDVCESEKVRVIRAIAIGKDDNFSAKTWPYKTGTTVPYPYPPQDLKNVFFQDCLAWTDCYGYKIGQGVWQNQDTVTFRDSVVYNAAVGMGIDHKFGTATVSNVEFRNMDIERLHGNAHGRASWLAIYIQEVGSGVGPIKNVEVTNVRARAIGSQPGWVQGYSDTAMVDGVAFKNILMGPSATPAKNLKDMNILETKFSKNLQVSL